MSDIPTDDAGLNAPVIDTEDGSAEANPVVAPRGRRWWIEWGVIVVVALLVATVIRLFIFQTFYIPSTSMLPTFVKGDRIVVNKIGFHVTGIQRGDIIVFSRPPHEHCGGTPVPDLVKRVIGLPTETISARGGQIYIDGKKLTEPWLPAGVIPSTRTFGPVHITANNYFMMGDNRTHSCDSRTWGTVTRSWIVGKAFLRIWPLSRFKFF